MTHPNNPFPLLPLRHGALLPGSVTPLFVGRSRSINLVRDLKPGHTIIGVAVQRDKTVSEPGIADLHTIGTFARVMDVQEGKKGFRVVLEGLERFRLDELVSYEPFWRATGAAIHSDEGDADEAKMLADSLSRQLANFDQDGNGPMAELLRAANKDLTPGALADRIAGVAVSDADKQIEVLLTLDVPQRLRLVARFVAEAIALNQTRQRIDEEVRKELNDNQREAVLRKQLKAIQSELGEGDENELNDLRERLDKALLPDEVRTAVNKELRKLEGSSPSPVEAGVARNWLEWIADLPWGLKADENFDIERMEQQLEADHHGLADVKKRIVEHMAVLAILRRNQPKTEELSDSDEPSEPKRRMSATILCLAGPPGVGKTSLGRSIAEATGRPFVRISLGGVRDEAEIRGHRRTYVGSRPGRILAAMKKAKVSNPVILLDEIDKLAHGGWSGDPEAALLEVLDPEQNNSFTDHFLEQPFDLSDVLFLCTANSLDTISGPLRDRMEIIEIEGYTRDDKLQIAKKHLIPRQLEAHALPTGILDISDEQLDRIIHDWTREPGVRQLERLMAKLCRAAALETAKAGDDVIVKLNLDNGRLEKVLGRPKFEESIHERTAQAGIATGLAWTPVGGDVLFVETSRMPGKGRIEITGQLGDVMKESARAALSYLRANADTLGVDADFLDKQDLHIHVPAGAVPKDGPSAGVTIFTALTSLLTGKPVRPDTAMTGEVTLRGRVLPVGGIKAKVLAAKRLGLERVILPKRNERDLEDLPPDVRESMEFILAENMDQVLAAALIQKVETVPTVLIPDEPVHKEGTLEARAQ